MPPPGTLLMQARSILKAVGLEGDEAISTTSTGHVYLQMPPLSNSLLGRHKFSLDTGGVAGFFGGDEVISAMATVHLYRHRSLLGWFNSSGSHTVAKHFGKIANSRFWDALFPGRGGSLTASLGLDSKKGHKCIIPFSQTKIRAGHLAHLLMSWRKKQKVEVVRETGWGPYDVTYMVLNPVDYDTPVRPLDAWKSLIALIPIAVSIVTSVMCALYNDWFIFSLILFGMLSSGVATAVIGRGELAIKTVPSRVASSPGNCILVGKDGVMVIKGEERDVNGITKGRFVIRHGSQMDDGEEDEKSNQSGEKGEEENDHDDEGDDKGGGRGRPEKRYDAVGICAFLLLVQFILQLLLVPQGTLFGQIMFLVSLGVSWLYNSYLSSLRQETIQAEVLHRKLQKPVMRRFYVRTRVAMAVFACLLVFDGFPSLSGEEEDINCRRWVLEELLPNKASDWEEWRLRIVGQLLDPHDRNLGHLAANEAQSDLLRSLLGDARTAFEAYFRVHDGPSSYTAPSSPL